MLKLQQIRRHADLLIEVRTFVERGSLGADHSGNAGHLVAFSHIFQVVDTAGNREAIGEGIAHPEIVLRNGKRRGIEVNPARFGGPVRSFDVIKSKIVVWTGEM